MKVYMKVSTRDQMEVGTQILRALNFAHVRLHVVTPPQPEALVLAHDSLGSRCADLDRMSPSFVDSGDLPLGDAQLTVEEFFAEVSRIHADLVILPIEMGMAEIAQIIEKTPCSILLSRSRFEANIAIKSVLATDHTLYANLAIEKFRSFRPSGFSGATVISTEMSGETSSGVAETRSMRIPDVEAARMSEICSERTPLLETISQQCLSRGANLLMIATHSLRAGLPGTLGGLLPEIIDNVDASVLILKAY